MEGLTINPLPHLKPPSFAHYQTSAIQYGQRAVCLYLSQAQATAARFVPATDTSPAAHRGSNQPYLLQLHRKWLDSRIFVPGPGSDHCLLHLQAASPCVVHLPSMGEKGLSASPDSCLSSEGSKEEVRGGRTCVTLWCWHSEVDLILGAVS